MKLDAKTLEGIERYALADRSDPFAYARAIAHVKQGLAGRDQQGNPVAYDAEEFKETRKDARGRQYAGTAYRNVKRI